MKRARLTSWLAGGWLLVLGCSGLDSCNGHTLGELIENHGHVDRDFAKQILAWSPAQVGARFDSGDGLRTGADASATLRMSGGAKVLVASDTTIRFKTQASDAQKSRVGLDVGTGSATVESSDAPFEITTELGLAVLSPGASMRVQRGEHGQRYDIVVGRATFAIQDGKQVSVAQGESIEVDVGLAQVLPKEPSAPAPDAEPRAPSVADASTAADAAVADGGIAPAAVTDAAEALKLGPSEPGLEYADVVVNAGSRATVYDLTSPTAVGFVVSTLCDRATALVRVGAGRHEKRFRASGQVNVPLPVGSHVCRVSCTSASGKPVTASSVIKILKRDGTARLPRSAATDVIDLDGRRYTLLFQNLLPQVQARWSGAPRSAGYVLHATFADGRTTTQTLTTPVYTWSSGAVPEGTSRMYFETSQTQGPRSRETQVVVKFDNAAPTASLQKPPAAGFARAPQIAVEGVALAQSSVSVNGVALPLDAQHRFSAQVAAPDGKSTRALAVRIEHPRSGVTYYLRRPLEP